MHVRVWGEWQEDVESSEVKKEKRKPKEKEFTLGVLRRLEKQVMLFGTSKLSEAAAAAKLGSSSGWNEEVVERAAACLWRIVEEDAKGTFESVMRNCLEKQDVRKPLSHKSIDHILKVCSKRRGLDGWFFVVRSSSRDQINARWKT